MSNASDAERILYAVIDGEIGFETVADVRAFIQNEWQAGKGLERESAQSALVVEAGDGLLLRDVVFALRWSPCSCWDHICRRCTVLDERFPGWRDQTTEWLERQVAALTSSSTSTPEASPDPGLQARLAGAESLIATLTEERDEARALADTAQELFDLSPVYHELQAAEAQAAVYRQALERIADIWHNKDAMILARSALAAVVVEQPGGECHAWDCHCLSCVQKRDADQREEEL